MIEELLGKVSGDKLAPLLLALAELADGWTGPSGFTKKQRWKLLLTNIAWVPLAGGHGHAVPCKAFAPEQPRLLTARLGVVQRRTASLSSRQASRATSCSGLPASDSSSCTRSSMALCAMTWMTAFGCGSTFWTSEDP